MLTKDKEEERKPVPSSLRSCEKRKGNSGLKEDMCFVSPHCLGRGAAFI